MKILIFLQLEICKVVTKNYIVKFLLFPMVAGG
ncbi:hypothetical protein Mucpa_1663 [Mucilaginibacter paludis DSM 18603]|uniref:Uncharacterized protein n=1 Tax=Mucilaginibacter paludis DSM 18603 TaxID=714943 RepID=H1Y6H6_9SPHI|nr:hypothetical protein Mucpa_1663 [Mucilaginibacter paludis DSM 18603]